MRCNSRIRMLICYQALLAQSLVCQGFSTIFGNLFTTRDLQPGVTEPWLVEYSMYLQNTQRIANFSTACGSVAAINRFQVPTSLHGEPLSRIILVRYSSFCIRVRINCFQHVYETMSSLIIGIEEFSSDRKHTRVNLHPPLDTSKHSSSYEQILANVLISSQR